MAYTKTTWVDNTTPDINATNLNHLETGVYDAHVTADAAVAKPSTPGASTVMVWNGSTWIAAQLTNAYVDAAAAIAYSKLNLAGAIVNADISNSAAIAIAKLANYPTDATKYLAGDGTWKSSPVVYRKTTAKVVNTTVSETDLLNGEITIAAGVMGTTGVARISAHGDWKQNSGGTAKAPRFKLKLGGTVLLDTDTPTTVTANVATRWSWWINAEIQNTGAANTQSVVFRCITFMGAVAGLDGIAYATGEGVTMTSGAVATPVQISQGWNSGAIDTATSKLVELTVINGSANANYETALKSANVEVF